MSASSRRGLKRWAWFRRDAPERPTDERERELLERIETLESRLEEVSARAERLAAVIERVTKLVVPPLVVIMMLLLTWFFWNARFDAAVARMATGLFVGKIAAAGGQDHFLFWLVTMGTLDVMIGLFFLWNVDVLYRVPWVGDRFREMEALARRFLLQYDALRRAAFVGVTIFIAIPVHGTGSITGSILGRLLGLGNLRTFLALVIAGYGGVAVVLSGSLAAVGLGRIDPWLMAGFLALVAVALVAFWWRYIRRVHRARDVVDGMEATPPADPPPEP